MLKQFGGDSLEIKEEIIDEAGCGSSSPKNVAADSTTNLHAKSKTIKCEATSTSTKAAAVAAANKIPKFDLKNEPIVKIEKLFEPNRKTNFTIQMDSKQIIDAVK